MIDKFHNLGVLYSHMTLFHCISHNIIIIPPRSRGSIDYYKELHGINDIDRTVMWTLIGNALIIDYISRQYSFHIIKPR